MYITTCQLLLQKDLFCAPYQTGRYLHNYGLTFALGLVAAPYFNNSAVPRYAEDFATLNAQHIYVLPAKPHTRIVGRAKALATGNRFEFMVLSVDRLRVPPWVRLGKGLSKAAVQVRGQQAVKAVATGRFTSATPVNPVDLPAETRLLTYDLIAMPPVSLLDHAQLAGPHYRLADGRCVAAGLAYRAMGERLQ
ncbi:MAG: type I-D CRISPR-associated protein Cas5/Csc1 [Caldilinea sp. CFX5]|nr:type I-D CRISPR-associated protein Cas5/Csc1 [Caldilinea sp. CFX5]